MPVLGPPSPGVSWEDYENAIKLNDMKSKTNSSGSNQSTNSIATTSDGDSSSSSTSGYDEGEVTERERLAAEKQKEIAAYDANAVRTQLAQQLANYDFANRQNRRLADVQLKQNSRKTSSDRFEAQRDLQNAALGLMGSMNQAMNGSTLGNLMRMLEDRNDKENNTYWAQHQVNQDQVENSYDDSVNQNNVAKRDAAANSEKALADIESNLAANLNNINPNLYEAPGTGSAALGASGTAAANQVAENNAKLSGYVMPDNSAQAARDVAPRNRVGGTDYFARLVNRFNGRM